LVILPRVSVVSPSDLLVLDGGRDGIVKLSEVGAVANHISLMRHI
jgi:hypothetical protein